MDSLASRARESDGESYFLMGRHGQLVGLEDVGVGEPALAPFEMPGQPSAGTSL